jgi:hypothetical protein
MFSVYARTCCTYQVDCADTKTCKTIYPECSPQNPHICKKDSEIEWGLRDCFSKHLIVRPSTSLCVSGRNRRPQLGSLVDLVKRSAPMGMEVRVRAFLILGGLLIVSLAINLLLARRVANLKRTIGVIKAESRLAPGDTLPAIVAKDPQGHPANWTIATLSFRRSCL